MSRTAVTGTQVTLGLVVDTGEGCRAREDRESLVQCSNTPWSDLEITDPHYQHPA